MKKIMLISMAILLAISVNAQMTLEHTSNASPTFYGKQWKYISVNEANVAYFRLLNSETNNIEFYDSDDFSLVESLHVQIADSFELSSATELPVGLYRNDNSTYYIIEYHSSTYDDNRSTLAVFKKVGNNLVSEQILVTAYVCGLYTIGYNGNKVLCEILRMLNNSGEYRIYSFAGTYSGTNQVEANNAKMMPYPNPSKDIIHLTFNEVKTASSIRVYDVNGKLMERIPVGSSTTEYLLDVHSYPEGVYFYEIDGHSQSFIVK